MKSRPSNKKTALFLLLGAIALAPSAQGLILVGSGNRPVTDPGWPEGALAVANLQSRVGWWEGPPFGGGQWNFLYRGDNQAFSEALEKFAAIRAPALDLVVHDGPEQSIFLEDQQNTNADTRIDWSFIVWVPESWNRLYNNPELAFLNRRGYRQPVDPPRLEVYISSGRKLDWAKVTVPNNIHVRDERASAAGVDISGGSVVRAEIKDIATGKPVKDAHLILDKMLLSSGTNAHWEKERLAEATSDSSGLAQIERIQTNQICLSATAEGYAPLRIVQRTLVHPELLKFTVELARASSVRGIVIDDEGKPLAGVKVRPSVQLSSNGRGYDNGLHYEAFDTWTVVTDSEGRFEMKELPTGSIQLGVRAPGFYVSDWKSMYDVPSTNIVLQLHGAGSVSVAVTGKDGKQISKYEGNPVIVNIDLKDGPQPGAWSSMATVNAEGLCEFKDMLPGEYRVSSRPNPGHAKATYPPDQIVTVTAGKTATIKMVYE